MRRVNGKSVRRSAKTERNDLIIRLFKTGVFTTAEIANLFGITRARVGALIRFYLELERPRAGKIEWKKRSSFRRKPVAEFLKGVMSPGFTQRNQDSRKSFAENYGINNKTLELVLRVREYLSAERVKIGG